MGTFAGMADIIRLLPDSVANQIAAGEVVQRPASALKELLENAIDSGGQDIRIVIREAGKSLIQVIDNGCGMSERDARLCFERHATSKIKTAEDLMDIRTLGFRGEALASIASVAQVELKSRRTEDEVGTEVIIEGSEIIRQGPVNCPPGTGVSVKNLFFNVPARRNFLKSNTRELKYLLDEFIRIALVNPDKTLTLYNQDKMLHQLHPATLKQRIAALFGQSYAQRLIPLEQHSSLVNITGFIGKPECAKKIRGEQYFFVNNRYIRNPSLNHAVETAFKELIPSDAFPAYFLFLEVNPRQIDVNIHPTKTEINFQDIKGIYAILQAAVKQSIGKFNLSPSLDFDTEQALDIPLPPTDRPILPPSIHFDPDYNPFEKKTKPQMELPFSNRIRNNTANWQNLYEHPDELPVHPEKPKTVQVNESWIMTHTKSGIVIIDPQHAHERILFERLSDKGQPVCSQRLLLPQTINLTPDQAILLEELRPVLYSLGFEIEPFGTHTFLVHSIPSGVDITSLADLIGTLMEQLLNDASSVKMDPGNTVARSLAQRLAMRRGKKLLQEEMDSLVEQLFACRAPELTPDGKPTLFLVTFDDLNRKFKI
jgi:DNA mismatch repair protein MutL